MYRDRDLSWLEFNYRVLQEAATAHNPLYERVRFLAIHSSNMDEFFSIRYPVVTAIAGLSDKTQKKIYKDTLHDTRAAIKLEIENQLKEAEGILEQTLIPELAQHKFVLHYNAEFTDQHLHEMKEIFLSKVLAFIQPVLVEVDLAKYFIPEDGKVYLLVSLEKEGLPEVQHYMLKLPSDDLQRFYKLSDVDGVQYTVFIDDIVRTNLPAIFPGYAIKAAYSICFNRDAELDLHDEFKKNIVKKIEKELEERRYAPISRLVYQEDMPDNILLFLKMVFKISDDISFAAGKYQHLSDLMHLEVAEQMLLFKPWTPLMPPELRPDKLFQAIARKDVLLHVPYQPYNIILSFFNQAAVDPEVDEIYIALYRVASDSLIINSLISAAKNGKKVTAFVELKARFDEANNLYWSKKMKDAGVEIIYSIPGIKVHAKIALIVKNKPNKRKMLSIIGTGNFNEESARIYTDHLLITADKQINTALLTLFHFLEKRVIPPNKNILEFDKICVSQFNMLDCFRKLVDTEIRKAKKKNGRIRIKMNNLEDPEMVDLLYKASNHGVKVQLIIRGICTLVPGIKDLSENITVKRLLGRYLEHTRIFIFGNDGEEEVLIGSADWMTRNLHHRIEVCVPVTDPECKKELVDYFNLQWRNIHKSSSHQIGTGTASLSHHDVQFDIYKYLAGQQ
ncbi:MAG: polyphosphate kinase 1 [Bacteroidetes bacterium]|nr:polyphosphate kinase 1 [Bacteroidota bacterium]